MPDGEHDGRHRVPMMLMASQARKHAERASLDRLLMEASLLAEELCPGARVEATTASYEAEDGHVRVYPPTGLSRTQIEEIEGR